MINIPNRETKILKQTNRSDILGSLWSTFNIDLQGNLGRIRLGEKLKLNTKAGDTGASALGLPVAFAQFDRVMWAMAGSRIFRNTASDNQATLLTSFVEDTSTGAQTTYTGLCDLIYFNSTLVSSTPSNVYSLDGATSGTWTSRHSSLQSGTLHKFCYLKSFDRLYVTDENTEINSCDTSWTFASPTDDYTLDIGDSSGWISTIEASADTIWIGTMQNTFNSQSTPQNASVFEWDGLSSQVTREYKIPAMGVYAIEIVDNIPHILDSNGVWRVFNGSGFEEIGRFPFAGQLLGTPSSTSPSDRYIHVNGTSQTPDGTILAFIGNKNRYLRDVDGGKVNENIPSGVWELSRESGITHKHSISYDRLTSSTNTNFGQNRISLAGAMSFARLPSSDDLSLSSIICGATYYTDASSTTNGIFVQAPFPHDDSTYPEGQKSGYLVTSWIDSQNLKDNWQKIAAKYQLNSSDNITLKYRTTKETPTIHDITWVTDTSFTTSSTIDGKEGYEVEVLSGVGGGACAHISSITGTVNRTVTLDQSVPISSGGDTARIRVQHWTKVETFDEFESVIRTIGVTSERIQIKCAMRFTGDAELHELIVINAPHELLE